MTRTKSSHTYIQGRTQCAKLPLLWDLGEAIGREPYPQFLFRETDSGTRTCDMLHWVEGTCHCTKARPLSLSNQQYMYFYIILNCDYVLDSMIFVVVAYLNGSCKLVIYFILLLNEVMIIYWCPLLKIGVGRRWGLLVRVCCEKLAADFFLNVNWRCLLLF